MAAGLLVLASSQAALANSERMKRVAALLHLEEQKVGPEERRLVELVEGLVSRTLATHPEIEASAARVAVRSAEREQAQSRYQPRVGVGGSTVQQESESLDTDRTEKGRRSQITLNVRENLWRGGQDSKAIQIAEQTLDLAKIDETQRKEAISHAVRRAALDFNYQAMQKLINEASLADAAELRGLAEKKFAAGQVGKVDVYTTQLRESSAKAQVQRGAIAWNEASLRLLSFASGEADRAVWAKDIILLAERAWPYPEPKETKPEGLQPTLRELSAKRQQEIAESTLSQTYRQRYLPELDLFGSVSQSQQDTRIDLPVPTRVKDENLAVAFGLELNWTLWDRTQDHRIHAAAAEKKLASATLQSAELDAKAESERLAKRIQDLTLALGPLREAHTLAGRLVEAQRKLYEAGVVGILPLIEAENEKLRTLSQWLDQIYELNTSLLRWESLKKGYLAP